MILKECPVFRIKAHAVDCCCSKLTNFLEGRWVICSFPYLVWVPNAVLRACVDSTQCKLGAVYNVSYGGKTLLDMNAVQLMQYLFRPKNYLCYKTHIKQLVWKCETPLKIRCSVVNTDTQS
jgi:hypothetical protein